MVRRGLIVYLALVFGLPREGHAFFPTIYGDDDRINLETSSLQDVSSPIAVAISSRYLTDLPWVKAPTLAERFRFCSKELFADEPSVGSCTGIHVGKGLILTARHCVKNKYDCEKFQWAFNYRNIFQTSFEVPVIYGCEKIVVSQENVDLTLLRLKNAPDTLPALTWNAESPVTQKVGVIGSPLGVPLKFSGWADVTHADGRLVAPMDMFQGNSGSPVFNENWEWVGIFLAGDKDFIFNRDQSCNDLFITDMTSPKERILPLKDLPREFIRHLTPAITEP